jgi:hypothetical protein
MQDLDKTKTTGVADYGDGIYTNLSPLTVNAETQLPCNKSIVQVENLPPNIATFWDSNTNKITGIQDGKNYNYDCIVSFKAKTTHNNNGFYIFLRDGANIYDRNPKAGIFLKGINVENSFEFVLPFYSGALPVANGFKIMLSTGTAGNYSIYGITIQIRKLD